MKNSKLWNKIKRSIGLRVISMVTLVATLLSLVSWMSMPAQSVNEMGQAHIELNGTQIQELTIRENEKVTVRAVCTKGPNVTYSWQIRDPENEDAWIRISNAFGQELAISYALISSMTDENGDAYIRCAVSGDTAYITAPLKVRVSYDTDAAALRKAFSVTTSPNYAGNTAKPVNDDQPFTTCSIIINYLFDNNGIAFEPYGASIAYGEGFDEPLEVISPPVVGYEPFRWVGNDYVPADKVILDFQNITEDIIINVIYEPAMVPFSIHHHKQNLHDDEYSQTADEITYGEGLTGSIVPENLAYTEEQWPGFRALLYERLTIAADGSTAVEIRYDRNYYLVDFDPNGGYGSEPVYTKFGDTVGANVPVRHGYIFDGWELVSYNGHAPTAEQQSMYAMPTGGTITVPNANLRYRARWKTTQTTYTMVFWKENADNNGYSYWGYLENLPAMSGSFVDGQDLISRVSGIDDEDYFTFNAEKTEKGVLVEGDGSTVVNVYYTRNYYKLTVKANAVCRIPEKHQHGDACYDVICDKGHTHDDTCVRSLICATPEHTAHTDACIECGKLEHTHGSADCDCNIPEHTHAKSCWNDVGNKVNNKPIGAPANPSTGQVYRRNNNNRYIYIKGSWYSYSGRASSGTIVLPSCSYSAEHTHGTSCSCEKENHTHSDTCYKDIIHTHSDHCYNYSCGQVAHVHSDNCYRLKCGITVNHTHTTNCNRSYSSNTVKVVYRKYEQSLEDIWPIVDDSGKVYNSGERWSPSDTSAYSQVLVFISKMLPDDFILTLSESTNSTYTMQYYMEVLPGKVPTDVEVVTVDGKQYALENTIKANYNYVTKDEDFFDIAGFVQYKSNPNFSGTQIKIDGSNKTVKFYYNRVTDHNLEFYSNGILLDDHKEQGILYGANIDQYNFVPPYPTNEEANSLTFAGWYTSPLCFDGTEVDWNTITMPEGDLLLYAKWVPIKHSVKVYLDDSYTTQLGQEQFVDHNGFASAPVDNVQNGNYIFTGWFYKEIINGEEVEKAFIFNGIPVKDDMKIYAKWSSHTLVKYKVNYVLHTTGEPIADALIGSAIAGNNQTFDAKAGDQLYAGYQTGFYPLVNSHTITMSVDGTNADGYHEFTFRYVFVESMPYTVRYVNAQGEPVAPDKVVLDNTLSVVTETFVRVPKMMPDAYQKRLVLSAKDEDGDGVYDDNVITFYYTEDAEHAYYKVVHNIQNIGADGYREYHSTETVGVIGTEYIVNALTLTGFTFNGDLTEVDGVVTPIDGSTVIATLGDGGMLINLYYDRVPYEYTVRYKDGSTGQSVLADKKGTALFGAQVVEYAPDLTAAGLQLASESPKMLHISGNPQTNVIEFLYLEGVVSVKYEVVGHPGCGSLSRNSENVRTVSGVPFGSVPTAEKNFRFVGWFMDVDCTVPVDPAMVNPQTNELKPTKAEGAIWQQNTVYYALFVPTVTDLTVGNSGWNYIDTDQVFMYRIQGVAGTDTESVDLIFTIRENGYTTITQLPVGTYTVTQIGDWAWRYDCEEYRKTITLSADVDENVLMFVNTRTDGLWLDGNASSQNLFS